MPPIPLPLEVQTLFALGSKKGEMSQAMSGFDSELRLMKQEPGVAVTQFNLFPRLPLEIQLKIFRSMLPGPRIMPLQDCNTMKHVICRIPPPIVLRISWGSRREALRFLKLLFPDNPIPFRARPLIYINPKIDTVFFPSLDCRVDYPTTLPQMLDRPCGIDDLVCNSALPIKNLSIDGACFESLFMGRGTANGQAQMASLLNFRELEVITLVLLLHNPYEGYNSRELDFKKKKKLGNVDRVLVVSALKPLQDKGVFWRILNKARRMVKTVADANLDWKVPELQVRAYVRQY